MRYVLIFIGAAVVAWLLAKGIRAFMSERHAQGSKQPDLSNQTPKHEQNPPEQ